MNPTSSHHQLPRSKRWVFLALIWAAIYGLCELVAALVLTYYYDGIEPTFQSRETARLADDVEFDVPIRASENVHPYIGFVRQPTFSPTARKQNVTEYGFQDVGSPLHKREKGRLIVGILGGSMAEQFAAGTCETLANELQKSEHLSDKQFVFVRLALGGHKQPQQLMTLTYLLVLGAQFDILVNLDGFNEMALAIAENVRDGVYPSFPRAWHTRVSHSGNQAILRLL